MRFLILSSLFLIGCSGGKYINFQTNVPAEIRFEGQRICNLDETTTCRIKLKNDSVVNTYAVLNKRNYFSKYFSLSGNMFSKDTTITVEF